MTIVLLENGHSYFVVYQSLEAEYLENVCCLLLFIYCIHIRAFQSIAKRILWEGFCTENYTERDANGRKTGAGSSGWRLAWLLPVSRLGILPHNLSMKITIKDKLLYQQSVKIVFRL